MLSINTTKNTKLVEIDGFAYQVRKPGAGEALTMQKIGRDVSKLGQLESLDSNQIAQFGEQTIEVLRICLSLFKSDDPKAVAHIQSLDVEVLLDVINQVFDEAEAS